MRQVNLITHTTCGIAFEVVDAVSGESLTGGRVDWCDEGDEEAEARGLALFARKIKKSGWELKEQVWS